MIRSGSKNHGYVAVGQDPQGAWFAVVGTTQ